MDPVPDPVLQHYKDRGYNCGQYPGGGKGVGGYIYSIMALTLLLLT